MITIKVLYLPRWWGEDNFSNLRKEIVRAVMATPGLEEIGEQKMLISLSHMPRYNDFNKILVEISGFMYHAGINEGRFTIEIGKVVASMFPSDITILVDFQSRSHSQPYWSILGCI